MPLNTNIKKVLVIGSGPIVIGQAAEFDYAGTQACLALKEEGLEVVLVNSNPATIMTDSTIADHVYIEPLTLDYLKMIIQKEKPDSILSTLGGQTGLTLSMQLAKEGFLKKYESADGALYQYNRKGECDRHFHLKCLACGKIIHLDCELMHSISDHIAKDHSFAVDISRTVIYGCCANCQTAKS